jgi:hypothetical protein
MCYTNFCAQCGRAVLAGRPAPEPYDLRPSGYHQLPVPINNNQQTVTVVVKQEVRSSGCLSVFGWLCWFMVYAYLNASITGKMGSTAGQFGFLIFTILFWGGTYYVRKALRSK